jgi:peptidyl-prolyl cis-trans isomerase C
LRRTGTHVLNARVFSDGHDSPLTESALPAPFFRTETDMAENKDQTPNAATPADAPTKKGLSVPTIVLLVMVVLMSVATIGYIAIQATNAQESKLDTAEAIPAEEVVVARVDGREYHPEDISRFMDTLPPQVRQVPLNLIYPSLIRQFVNLQLATEQAYKEGMDSDPEVQEKLKFEQDRIVRDVFLDRFINNAVTEQKLDEAYNEFLLQNPAETEVRARHILVDSEEKARELIAKLDGGADFEELAKSESTGPSSSNGGDLGYFTKDRMVKPFSDAAFAMEIGAYTKDPVQTEFGWHVIKVEDRRQAQPPSKEEVEAQLRDRLGAQAIQAYFEELRQGKDIAVFDLQGKPLADEPAAVPAGPTQ